MKLPPEGARWLVSLRWLACAVGLRLIWLTSSALGIIANPAPLYVVACAMLGYNLVFRLRPARGPPAKETSTANIFLQVAFDLVGLDAAAVFRPTCRATRSSSTSCFT